MSLKATSWAWEIPTIEIGMVNKFVLLALADYADKDGICWPSQATLGDKVDMCERSVRKALSWLESAGYITRESRSSTAGRRSDLIILSLSESRNRQDIPVAQPAKNGHPTGIVVPVATIKIESVSKNQQAERLYNAYPLKVGRKVAIKAITKALESTSFDVLMDAVEEFAKASAGMKLEDKQYIAHPSTWFNAGRWEDDRSAWWSKSASNQRSLFTMHPTANRPLRPDEMP